MRKKIYLFVLFMVLGFSAVHAQSVEVLLSKSVTTTQDPVQLTLIFQDMKSSPRKLDFTGLKDFKIVGGPYFSTQYTMTNGKSSLTKKLSYDILPLKEGSLTIPSFSFKSGKKTIQTQALTLQVNDVSSPSAADPDNMPDIFIETLLPHETFFLGETFTVTYRLWTRKTIDGFNCEQVSTLEGFIVDKVSKSRNPQTYQKTMNGVEYLTADIMSLTLTGTQVGELTLPALTFVVSIRKSGYDSFFGMNTSDHKLFSAEKEIGIQPLPPGAGAKYTGAVGDFFMTVSLDSSRVRENQSVVLRAEVSGHGNLDHFTFPRINFPRQLEHFEPDVKKVYSVGGQDFSGRKIWEYIIIPGMPGIYEFNDISFTFFSTTNESFQTIRAEPLVLDVFSAGQDRGDAGRSQLGLMDIRYIKVRESRLINTDYNALADPHSWFAFIIAAFFLLFMICLKIILNYREKNMGQILKRNAPVNAIQGLMKISPKLRPEENLTILDSTLETYFNHKYERSLIDIRRDDSKVEDICKTIETYKYAPGILHYEQLNNLKKRILDVIENMEGKES